LQDENVYSDLAYYTELAYCLSVVPYSDRLPRTIQEALHRSSRAIVVTEAVKPFRIVDVNKAWEDLCGYTYAEAKDKTLGSLLRGPDTESFTGDAMFAQLLRGEEAVATLTNYTKDYRAFRNRLQVGPLMDGSDVTHFVGVLQEV
jgi:PAS domain S-box-containing protein